MRSRPDVVAAWSNQEVVARYWRLHPQRKNEDGSAADPTDAELNIWLNDAVRMKQIRQRLSDISWWMGRLSQKIAVRANHEDKCTGRFWEGRYKSQALLDAVVPNNPVRDYRLKLANFKKEQADSNPRGRAACHETLRALTPFFSSSI